MRSAAPRGKVDAEEGDAMIRAVRHFLWYLDHHAKGGRHPHRPTRSASIHLGTAPDKAARLDSRASRKRADDSGLRGPK